MHWPSLVVGALLGALASVLLTVHVHRPLLSFQGVTGGATSGTSYVALEISNNRGLIGLRLEPTTILGRRVHGRRHVGWTFDRDPATHCWAELLDEDGNHVAPLYWIERGQDKPETLVLAPTIEPRLPWHLVTACYVAGESGWFFINQVDADGAPVVPAVESRFHGQRELTIRITYSDNRNLRTKVVVEPEGVGRPKVRFSALKLRPWG